MILQSVVYPCDACRHKEIYYQCDVELRERENRRILPEKENVSFFSYMNLFDAEAWKKFTTVALVRFRVRLYGRGTIVVRCAGNGEDRILDKLMFDVGDEQEGMAYELPIDLESCPGVYYFEIMADSEVGIAHARFEAYGRTTMCSDVRMALNICTYRRKNEVQRIVNQLRNSRFWKSGDELHGKLYVMIVDNGSELKQTNETNLRILHNSNTGGSGGFAKGLRALKKKSRKFTHVIFMDDDVELITESLYRLYALLLYMRDEFKGESVAGRMFRQDKRWVQYTAAEIWNKGNLQHIGFNQDMTDVKNIYTANVNEHAEYGGWWFCCYPMEYAGKNKPKPFFLHCDDVEYGLRHGGTPIILNGIQIWHETYEYRTSPLVTYYDTRNALIVNRMFGLLPEREELIAGWKEKLREQQEKGDVLEERMILLGICDFLRGVRWFDKHNSLKNHLKIIEESEHPSSDNETLWKKIVFLYDKGIY